jgi:hypothetical protein
MIKQIIMFGAQCDNCKKEWYDDHNGFIAMNDESSIETVLMESEWIKGDEKFKEGKNNEHYCPECYGYDDNDDFILLKSRKNNHEKT